MKEDAELEKEMQALGLTAPRITPADIEAAIASEHFFTAYDGATYVHVIQHGFSSRMKIANAESLQRLTFCVLVLKNGFIVTGESACASPANFDAEIGRKIARAKAIEKIWPLLGFQLRTRLHEEAHHDA